MTYIPIIKSTQSELQAVKHLDKKTKDGILPVFELTKSRNTKLVPEGDIYRSYKNIIDNYQDRPFILDLTSHESLMNSQIENFFDVHDGYSNWCNFINELDNKNIYPAIQIDADESFDEVTKQVKALSKISNKLALRVGIFDFSGEEIASFLEAIYSGLSKKSELVLILDAGYIKPRQSNMINGEIKRRWDIISKNHQPNNVFIASSSFPRSVVMSGYGGDENGLFPLEEVALYESLIEISPEANWGYSDYGSIHPKRYDTRGGGWVPRVDFPLDGQIYYYRYRRDEGSYSKAALGVISNKNYYKPIECWGETQIKTAATGSPKGKSPSFWIAVRMNMHITRQLMRLNKRTE